jgi:hypothetical protein
MPDFLIFPSRIENNVIFNNQLPPQQLNSNWLLYGSGWFFFAYTPILPAIVPGKTALPEAIWADTLLRHT